MSELLHEKRGLTTEMASRASKVAGGSPESWLRMQEALDIRQAEMMKNKGKTKGHSLCFAAEIIAKQSECPFVELSTFIPPAFDSCQPSEVLQIMSIAMFGHGGRRTNRAAERLQ